MLCIADAHVKSTVVWFQLNNPLLYIVDAVSMIIMMLTVQGEQNQDKLTVAALLLYSAGHKATLLWNWGVAVLAPSNFWDYPTEQVVHEVPQKVHLIKWE